MPSVQPADGVQRQGQPPDNSDSQMPPAQPAGGVKRQQQRPVSRNIRARTSLDSSPRRRQVPQRKASVRLYQEASSETDEPAPSAKRHRRGRRNGSKHTVGTAPRSNAARRRNARKAQACKILQPAKQTRAKHVSAKRTRRVGAGAQRTPRRRRSAQRVRRNLCRAGTNHSMTKPCMIRLSPKQKNRTFFIDK
jgi:hypothetical protein